MSNEHQEHLDRVFLYALQTLTANEFSSVEAHISACSMCRRELETLRPVIDSFVMWPTDVLRPPASLWNRLAQRIANETGKPPFAPPEPTAIPEWKDVAAGIF